MEPKLRYTTGDAMLEALQETGVSYLFCNLGSDHQAIIEALAKAKRENRKLPKPILCPHEFVALSAAHGHTMISGQPQAVIVHTDVGTINLGGALHNVARSQMPVFIFSGETPYTLEGELRGTRNININNTQDVFDQRGIVRNYMKWDYSIRTGRNVKQLVYRGMQLATSAPMGPVYLSGAREVMEEELHPDPRPYKGWSPIEPIPLPRQAAEEMIDALLAAERPLLITSSVGRNVKAVPLLVELCEKLAIPVIENIPKYMNFPTDHDLHVGYQGADWIRQADVIVVIEAETPWMNSVVQPSDQCKVYYIDMDPLKEDIPLWYYRSEKFCRADSYEALKLLNAVADQKHLPQERIAERRKRIADIHRKLQEEWQRQAKPAGSAITPQWLAACVKDILDEDTIVLNESISGMDAVHKYVPRNVPGCFYTNGGSSLGWSGGASIGAKLARPDKHIVTLVGDGSYFFGVPSVVHWMARRYQTPFLTVIFNNQGWNATKQNYLGLYPDGLAHQMDSYWVNFEQPANLAHVAEAAGGAYAETVHDAEQLPAALRRGMEEVRKGRAAVIDVRMQKVSNQQD
jgi:acetolactate synthase-1/2/3 large subunit